MGRFRQGSLARRVAITAFALYALLLQGFLAASAPAAAFAFPGGIISCAQDGSGSGTGDPVRHHGLCCILACAAVAAPSAVSVFSPRVASAIPFAPAPGIAARSPVKYYFAARGPPENL
ncbi:MAG: hypothetical protein ACREDA_01160 [Methylocella sp.]